jgi:hypothetical protein
VPKAKIPYINLNMKTHSNRDGSTNWESLFGNVNLDSGALATVQIEANGQNGQVPVDAVRFVCTSKAIDDKVDNSVPTTVPSGSTVFLAPGFYTNDWVNRSFEDMQDESSTHNKYSKVPFFLICACSIDNYLYQNPSPGSMDNLGSLLALGHNGLICMGTSDNNFPARSYAPYINDVASGLCFGRAFIDQANSSFFLDGSNNLQCMYALLGAGTLRAQPYIQFGSVLEQNKTVSTTVTNNSTSPVLIKGVTVTSAGIYTVSSTVTTTGQNCAHSDIEIRPETVFQAGSHVTIKAN